MILKTDSREVYKKLPQTYKTKAKKIAAEKLNRSTETIGDFMNGIREIPCKIDSYKTEQIHEILTNAIIEVSKEYNFFLENDIEQKRKASKTFQKYLAKNIFINSKI